MKSLASQALDRVGKDWSVASETREAKMQTITRFCEFVQKTYGLENISNLKTSHIQGFADNLHAQGVSARTGANYMAFVRDVAAAIGKANIVARDNAAYGFGGESRQNPINQDRELVAAIRSQLDERAGCGDQVAQMMSATAAMRAEFGLRQKEAQLSHEVRMVNGKPNLVVEGAKGGRPRMIEIRTDGQRAAISHLRETATALNNAQGRPIPTSMNLKQAMRAETKAWRQLGGTKNNKANMHSQRHDYAQGRAAEGVPKSGINSELGHGEQRSIGAYIP